MPDAKTIQVVLDSLTNILRVGVGSGPTGGNPCVDWLEEMGGLDKIEQLQNHENEEVYQKSLNIIEKYFSEADLEETSTPMPQTSQNGLGYQLQAPVLATGGFSF